jgi:predicted RecA/RadA family phage recombinase
MKNFIQEGETLTLAAPYNVLSGEGLLVGSIFGVAAYDAISGAAVETQVEGVFDLKKTSAQAWTVGVRVYWDDAAKECTTTASTNKLVGVAVAAAANPSALGRVRLSAAFTL